MLNVTIENLGDVTVLHCLGRVVAGAALAALRETAMCHLARQPVVLDFSDVTAIDASGLGTLVFLHTCAYGIGSELRLVGLKPHVRMIFEITSLLYVFDISSEIDTAFGEPCETC